MNRGHWAALVCVCCAATVTSVQSPARAQATAVVFPVSFVEHLDVRNQLLTFKTQDGQLRMLRVAESVGITRTSFVKGDLVRIEVDLDDRIVNIAKVPQPPPDRRAARVR